MAKRCSYYGVKETTKEWKNPSGDQIKKDLLMVFPKSMLKKRKETSAINNKDK